MSNFDHPAIVTALQQAEPKASSDLPDVLQENQDRVIMFRHPAFPAEYTIAFSQASIRSNIILTRRGWFDRETSETYQVKHEIQHRRSTFLRTITPELKQDRFIRFPLPQAELSHFTCGLSVLNPEIDPDLTRWHQIISDAFNRPLIPPCYTQAVPMAFD